MCSSRCSEQRAKPRLERPVQLDDMQEARARREALGQDPLPAADLEDDIVGRELRQPLDHVEDVAVDEEVLAERYHPNTAVAAPSTDASSEAYSTRRSTASACAVSTTRAGSFGLPRIVCGER